MAGTATISKSGLFADPREDWLALHSEDVIDPARPIVDPHHHLWDRGGERYLIEEMAADIATGHNVVATVYVDCRSMYRAQGPEPLRPVGEVEFANGVAAMSASGGYGPAAICAGIVGHVDLRLGEAARTVLEAEIAASPQRFRGIRHSSAWDADPNVAGMYATRPQGLLRDSSFRKGFACLAPLGLSFDAWLFHPQIPELTDLARAFPDTRIVLNHCGGPVGIGRYADRRDEVFATWKASIGEIARCPNVVVKLGGLAMRPGLRFSRTAQTAHVGTGGRGVAALYRDLHRSLRPGSLHVREQFSTRQGPVQLSGDLQRLQTHRRAIQRDGKNRAVFGDSGQSLQAGADLRPIRRETATAEGSAREVRRT